MALKFRNIDTDPADPVETWGSEGVLTALDRCDLTDWSRVLRVVEADPWGKVVQQFEITAERTEDRGAGAWAKLALARVREKNRNQRLPTLDLPCSQDLPFGCLHGPVTEGGCFCLTQV